MREESYIEAVNVNKSKISGKKHDRIEINEERKNHPRISYNIPHISKIGENFKMYSKKKENKRFLKGKKIKSYKWDHIKLEDKTSFERYFNGLLGNLYCWSNSNLKKHEQSFAASNSFDYR